MDAIQLCSSKNVFLSLLRALKAGAYIIPQDFRNLWVTDLERASSADDFSDETASFHMESTLVTSAWASCSDMVSHLLSKGVSVDAVGSLAILGATPLFTAAALGHLGVARILVDAGADMSLACQGSGLWSQFKGTKGFTPLLIAAKFGHLEIAKLLIAAGADIESADPSGATPIYHAACHGHTSLLRVLVEAGARLDQETVDGGTPLSLAALNGHLEAVQVLVSAGVDPNRIVAKAGPGEQGKTGRAVLIDASFKGHLEVVRFLIGAGADVNLMDGSGFTPLMAAAASGHLEVVRCLVGKGAAADNSMPAQWVKGMPLIYASAQGHLEVIACLIEAGANPNYTGFDKSTPLCSAGSNGHVEAVEYLLRKGAHTANYSVSFGAVHISVSR